MLQDNVVLKKVKVSELITLAMSYFNNPLSYEEVVELAHLEELKNMYVEKLSGGQKRRVNFGMTILSNSDLIVLDEPTASMDTFHRAQLWQTVKELRSRGKTFMITTHNLDELEDRATYALVLDKGQFIYQGYIHDLKSKLNMSYMSFFSDKDWSVYKKAPGVKQFYQYQNEVKLATNQVPDFLLSAKANLKDMDQLEIKRQSLEQLVNHLYQEEETK